MMSLCDAQPERLHVNPNASSINHLLEVELSAATGGDLCGNGDHFWNPRGKKRKRKSCSFGRESAGRIGAGEFD